VSLAHEEAVALRRVGLLWVNLQHAAKEKGRQDVSRGEVAANVPAAGFVDHAQVPLADLVGDSP